MQIRHFIFNALQENTYVVFDSQKRAAVIDPGSLISQEQQRLADYIEHNGLHLETVLCTHLHFDHQCGAQALKARFGVPVMAMEADLPVLWESKQMAAMMLGSDAPVEGSDGPALVTDFLHDRQVVQVGDMRFEVIHTPGHTPGGCCFYEAEEKALFSGDTLFQGSVGRTDFAYGSYADLIQAISRRLEVLPDDVNVFPGHGPATTIGQEKQYNPFL